MMRLLYIVFGLVILLVVAVAAIPFLVPTDTITAQVIQSVKESTGRELKIGSDPKFSLFPSIALEARDVAISNPGGLATGSLLAADEIQVNLALMPLFSGDVDVKKFVLVKPVIDLKVAKDGSANWDFGNGETAGQESTSGSSTDAGSPVGLENLRLGQIEIVDGTVLYADETSNGAFTLNKINVALGLRDISSPLEAKGAAVWNGENVELEINLGQPKALMDGGSTSLVTKLSSKHITSSFDGTVSADKDKGVAGTLAASSPSIRDLAKWAGNPLAPGNGLGPFSVRSSVKYANDTMTLSDAEIGLDDMNAKGSAVVALGGDRPNIKANLGVDSINVNKYLSGGGAAGSGASSSGGQTGSGGWNDAKIDFSGLNAVNADLNLAASQILYNKIKIGKSALAISLQGGKLSANLSQLALYGGNGKGKLSLNGAAETPALNANFAIAGIDGFPLLQDAADMKWLEGTGQLSFDIAASGVSQRQMVSTLGGKAKLVFADGAIRGINIAQMIRTLGTSALTGWSDGGAQKTDFSSFSSSFSIKNGIASSTDLSLIGPLVRITGGGSINMPQQSINYRVNPKLVASLEGQGGGVDLAGLKIPVVIEGPWSNPKIYPDIKGILENPEAAFKALEGLGKGGVKGIEKGVKDVIKDGNPEDIIKDVLKPKDGEKSKDPLGGVLKKLF